MEKIEESFRNKLSELKNQYQQKLLFDLSNDERANQLGINIQWLNEIDDEIKQINDAIKDHNEAAKTINDLVKTVVKALDITTDTNVNEAIKKHNDVATKINGLSNKQINATIQIINNNSGSIDNAVNEQIGEINNALQTIYMIDKTFDTAVEEINAVVKEINTAVEEIKSTANKIKQNDTLFKNAVKQINNATKSFNEALKQIKIKNDIKRYIQFVANLRKPENKKNKVVVNYKNIIDAFYKNYWKFDTKKHLENYHTAKTVTDAIINLVYNPVYNPLYNIYDLGIFIQYLSAFNDVYPTNVPESIDVDLLRYLPLSWLEAMHWYFEDPKHAEYKQNAHLSNLQKTVLEMYTNPQQVSQDSVQKVLYMLVDMYDPIKDTKFNSIYKNLLKIIITKNHDLISLLRLKHETSRNIMETEKKLFAKAQSYFSQSQLTVSQTNLASLHNLFQNLMEDTYVYSTETKTSLKQLYDKLETGFSYYTETRTGDAEKAAMNYLNHIATVLQKAGTAVSKTSEDTIEWTTYLHYLNKARPSKEKPCIEEDLCKLSLAETIETLLTTALQSAPLNDHKDILKPLMVLKDQNQMQPKFVYNAVRQIAHSITGDNSVNNFTRVFLKDVLESLVKDDQGFAQFLALCYTLQTQGDTQLLPEEQGQTNAIQVNVYLQELIQKNFEYDSAKFKRFLTTLNAIDETHKNELTVRMIQPRDKNLLQMVAALPPITQQQLQATTGLPIVGRQGPHALVWVLTMHPSGVMSLI